MHAEGEVLVVSCYELGRQPIAAAAALAELRHAGFRPAALDVSVQRVDDEALRRARLVAISVPMHTALRLGVAVARHAPPDAHVCFFGLYAQLNAQHLLARHGHSIASDELELRAIAESLANSGTVYSIPQGGNSYTVPKFVRGRDLAVPSRAGLPVLDRYARLEIGGEKRLVASVEASRGCKHLCRHCPIVPVWRGRFVAVPRETVLADVEQQVAAGARHVTFADPDFLNGPTHALRLARDLHARWPELTFDATIKIEHLLAHREMLDELASCGLLFVTSAAESLSDRVLFALRKGHRAGDVPEALRAVRSAGIDLRPTLLPYTPWTELDDLPALFAFAEEHDLLQQIDPVQYTLRLLIPPGSAILEPDEPRPWLGQLDPEQFGWSWTHPDPRVEELQHASAALAARDAEAQADPIETFARLRALACDAAGVAAPRAHPRPARREAPRLTEPWFC
jgi:radical SAM superfamily enzyme YgiQ (UPF0313 family)